MNPFLRANRIGVYARNYWIASTALRRAPDHLHQEMALRCLGARRGERAAR